MADPVIEGGIRVLAQGHAGSSSEEVIFANSWVGAMTVPGPLTSSGAAEFAGEVKDFYNNVGAYLSKAVGFMTFKWYDLGEPPPRTPTELIGLTTASSGASLPSEVAVCLSYFSGVVPRPRKRGRLFLGPLKQSVIDNTPTIPRVSTTFANDVITAIGTLTGALSLTTWGLLSQRDEVIYAIDAGYVDNAFDIQRRRGEDPTTRTTFTV